VPLPPGGVTPTAEPPPVIEPVEVPNYNLWWSLFFDTIIKP